MALDSVIEPILETQHQQRPNATTTVTDEPELLIEYNTTGSVLFDKAYQVMESFASTRIGQFVLERGDRTLRIFEDTAKWSLPQETSDDSLMRPLPWILFLALIVFLRQLRIWLSLCALLIGNGPVTAHTLIYFIQTRRRKLRSIRIHGMKEIQQREHARKLVKKQHAAGFMEKLGKFFTIVVCRPRQHCEPAGKVFAVQNSELQELLQLHESIRFTCKRQRENDTPEADLNCSQLLSKYANENSDDDSDYVPIQEEEDTNNESTLSVNSSNDMQGEYSMDTSDENAKDLNLTEKEESKEAKLPKEKKLPTIEIKDKAAENNSVTNNNDRSEKEQPVLGKSGNDGTASPKSPHTPLENGPKQSDELGGTTAVVQANEVSKPQKENLFNLLNGHTDVLEKKATPGHQTAADSKPHISPPLLSNVVNAINPESTDPTAGIAIDAVDDCFAYQIENLTNELSSVLSPTYSTTSSTSSLASFETCNDCNFVDDGCNDPPTPTPSINASSSTEDIYQSPYGSPTDFNAFHNPLAKQQKPVVAFCATEDPPEIDDLSMHKSKQFKAQPEYKTQQKQSHYQRYRKNRH